MTIPLYSIGTWDTDAQAYTPQIGVDKSFNLTVSELRQAMKRLKYLGYSCHRRGNMFTGHEDNDWMVLVERTDGETEAEILEFWKR
jgi:hypothetical protein